MNTNLHAPPAVHLVCGPTAAGKTTRAQALAEQHRAVALAIDDWMHTLFEADRPQPLDLPWVMARVARCQQLMWATSTRILGAGTSVVLEMGLGRFADRQRVRALAQAAGFAAHLHFVDAERATRWQRVQQRNAERGATFSFEITPAMFEVMERFYEPPTTIEQAAPLPQTSARELTHG